jgi:hypothetical protein
LTEGTLFLTEKQAFVVGNANSNQTFKFNITNTFDYIELKEISGFQDTKPIKLSHFPSVQTSSSSDF